MSSTAAFSLLFLIPAASAAALWIILRVLDTEFGLGHLHFYPWVLVVLSPAVPSAGVAHWACRRSGTAASTAWGFSIAAALMTVLFAIVTAAWLLNGGE